MPVALGAPTAPAKMVEGVLAKLFPKRPSARFVQKYQPLGSTEPEEEVRISQSPCWDLPKYFLCLGFSLSPLPADLLCAVGVCDAAVAVSWDGGNDVCQAAG